MKKLLWYEEYLSPDSWIECPRCEEAKANLVVIEISHIASIGNLYICRECFLEFADFVRNVE